MHDFCLGILFKMNSTPLFLTDVIARRGVLLTSSVSMVELQFSEFGLQQGFSKFWQLRANLGTQNLTEGRQRKNKTEKNQIFNNFNDQVALSTNLYNYK